MSKNRIVLPETSIKCNELGQKLTKLIESIEHLMQEKPRGWKSKVSMQMVKFIKHYTPELMIPSGASFRSLSAEQIDLMIWSATYLNGDCLKVDADHEDVLEYFFPLLMGLLEKIYHFSIPSELHALIFRLEAALGEDSDKIRKQIYLKVAEMSQTYVNTSEYRDYVLERYCGASMVQAPHDYQRTNFH